MAAWIAGLALHALIIAPAATLRATPSPPPLVGTSPFDSGHKTASYD